MGHDTPLHDIKILIGITVVTIVVIFCFWYIMYGNFPVSALFGPGGNSTVPGNGTPLDPVLEKVVGVESYFTDMGKDMMNGSYWNQ